MKKMASAANLIFPTKFPISHLSKKLALSDLGWAKNYWVFSKPKKTHGKIGYSDSHIYSFFVGYFKKIVFSLDFTRKWNIQILCINVLL